MTELTYVLSGIGLFLLGFGASQLAFVIRLSAQIKVNMAEINGIKGDFIVEKKSTNQRFTDMISLVQKMVEQNTVVIAELRAKK